MFYKTPKTSETGQKFEALFDKMRASAKAMKDFLDEFNTTQYRPGGFDIEGCIGTVVFVDTVPDKTLWSPITGREHEYKPNRRTKAGKELQERINKLPRVTRTELNACIGWRQHFSNIGFRDGVEVVGFSVTKKHLFDEENPVIIPADCIEITYSEYQSI